MTKPKKGKEDELLVPESDEAFALEASEASTEASTGKSEFFAAPITALPKADIPLEGITAYLSQSDTHQIVFMHFEKDVQLPEHSHAAQVGFVLEGEIELTVAGVSTVYTKGDRYYIQAGALHSARIRAGYADITFFDEPQRYKKLHSPPGGDAGGNGGK